MRQFGPLLPEEITTGFMLKFGTKTKELGSVEPTHFLREDEMDIEIAGTIMAKNKLNIFNRKIYCVFS